MTLGAPFRSEVLEWGRSNRRLTNKGQRIVQIHTSMPRPEPKDCEAQHAMTVLQKLKDAGYVQA